ncbi:hypothetical protein P9027_26330 [Bacillus thuringiensis]|uniref:hypothetical protein n=1 Tax=Bacillus thuringiensis TaxID=1428 RepID=UPI002DBADD91|nr:hypothetical protein [Bacillus thuringiensis]MEC3225470.1 hypothetical protein [Bacillus thuringiensis]MEC3465318.1 hypothetical protein [Bacillus thuringiensis]MEC3556172.1 hypothetical protein [Bacillus thuringiensis]
MKKSLLEKFLSAFSNNIPGKGLSNYLYQQIQQLTSKKDIDAFSAELKERVKNIGTASQFELVNLGTALYAAFSADREFKKGWIVDGYWEVYNKCNEANKAVLTGVSGW